MPSQFLLVVGGMLLVGIVLWSFWFDHAVTRLQPPAGEFIDTPCGRLHVVERGRDAPEDLPPVILIHGSTTNALDMDVDLGLRLEGERRVFMPDRPGHGFSGRPPDGWRLDVQAAAIRHAAQAAGIERPIVLGQSYGGAVALRYALDYGDEIAGLCLVAPVTHPWPGGCSWYNRLGVHPLIGPLLRRTFIPIYGRFGSPRGVANALKGCDVVNRYHARTRVFLTFRPRHFRHNNEDIVRLYEQLFAMAARYDEISVPTEVVAGSHDMTVMTSVHARALVDVMPDAALEVIPGGGHALHHSHPDAVTAALGRLDARVASRGRSTLQGALRRLSAVFPRSA